MMQMAAAAAARLQASSVFFGHEAATLDGLLGGEVR
jgi:hypothetical protein